MEARAAIAAADVHEKFKPVHAEILSIIGLHEHCTVRYVGRYFDAFPKHGLLNYIVLAAAFLNPASVYGDEMVVIENGLSAVLMVAKRVHAGKGIRGLPDSEYEGEGGLLAKLIPRPPPGRA